MISASFLQGYALGKSNASEIDMDATAARAERLMEHCRDNPRELIVSAMQRTR